MCRACVTSLITNHLTSSLWRTAPSRREFLAYAVWTGAAAAVITIGREAQAADGAEIIFRNGTIYPMTAGGRPVEALAISGGKILAAGSAADMSSLAGGATRIIDLQGRTLFPGFIDPHHHTVLSALLRRSAAQCRLPEILKSRRRARRAESRGRESAAGAMDSRRLLRQPPAGRRSVDGGSGRDLDPASDFRLLRQRTRRRRQRHGVQARQDSTGCRRTARRRPFRAHARRQVERLDLRRTGAAALRRRRGARRSRPS